MQVQAADKTSGEPSLSSLERTEVASRGGGLSARLDGERETVSLVFEIRVEPQFGTVCRVPRQRAVRQREGYFLGFDDAQWSKSSRYPGARGVTGRMFISLRPYRIAESTVITIAVATIVPPTVPYTDDLIFGLHRQCHASSAVWLQISHTREKRDARMHAVGVFPPVEPSRLRR